MPGIVLLLPCFNEAQALPGLIQRLSRVSTELRPEWELSVLVVDDGSTDVTSELARREIPGLHVELVVHLANRGLGAVLQTGIEWFLAHTAEDSPDVLGMMDADATHPPELLPEMLACLMGAGGTTRDVVTASRYAPGGEEHGLSPLRLIYSRLASIGMKLVGRVRGARDYSCGYRLYRRSILQSAIEKYGQNLVTCRGFACMAELLVKLGRRGARVGEVPLKLHYELKEGASKMNVAATIRSYMVLAWQVLFKADWR